VRDESEVGKVFAGLFQLERHADGIEKAVRLLHAERAQDARDKRLRAAINVGVLKARGIDELVGDVAAPAARHQNL
jgi:predicted secreted protein